MRVVAGRLGGRTIAGPPARSREVRPTSDRARETLFAILGDVSDLLVLDLFCGTGALAIEAISRGADSAVLVDRKPGLARRNVTELGIANRCELVRSDAIRYLEGGEQRFGLICCDPPYRLADRVEPALAEHLPRRLARHGRVAVECSARRPLELDLPLVAERRIGEALIRVWSER
ncbi:MAG: RsmD family RNA methyltransferase [Solirubrobacterales bacterium]